MQDLFGVGDTNIKLLERELGVMVVTRDGSVEVQGEDETRVESAIQVLGTLDRMRQIGEPMNEFAVTRAMGFVREGDPEGAVAALKDVIAYTYTGAPIKCRTLGQRKYVKAMDRSTVTIAIGPAGTGKTYLAVASAVAALKRKEITKIVMCRPAVEAGRSWAFCPATCRTRWTPTCGRFMTPFSICWGRTTSRSTRNGAI